MKIRIAGSILILLAIVATIGLTRKHIDNRTLYEESILNKANKINAMVTKGEVKDEAKSPDQPDMAAFQEYIMTADPATGTVPKDRLIDAYKETKRLESEYSNTTRTNNLMDWETTGSNMGGRTRAMMFDPNDDDNVKVWAGGVTGGLWFTYDITNTSEEWEPVGDFWSDLSISCITYDPNNTETFFVGTGEAQTARIIYRASSGLGAGIFVTYDAGDSWQQMESTEGFDYITDIAVHDEDGTSVIYACVASGTYEGVDHQSTPSDGVFRSDDGGESWQQVLPLIPSTSEDEPYTPADIEITSDGRIFVGTMENLNGNGGATILYSDSGLSGSWTIYNDYNQLISSDPYYKIPARTLVASSPSNPDVIYAQFAAGYTSDFVRYTGRYMAKSTTGGDSWTSINIPGTDWATLAWHAFVLKVDPFNPDAVYTGGLDLHKSVNGGSSWAKISNWVLMYYGGGDEYIHADQHCIQFQPGSNSCAIFSCDGGIFLSETANYTYPVFEERNQGFGTLQFYTCAMNPVSGAEKYIGGLQDNGTLYYKGSPLDINDMIDGGDGAYCFWDKNNPNTYITSVYYNQYTSWDNNYQADNFGGNSGTFTSPADYDYLNNILYSNACDFTGGNADRLLRSSGIPYQVQDALITLGTGTNVPFSHVSYSEYSPENTSTLFVGTVSGKLYKVTNAESEPVTTDIGSNNFPTANLSCVAIGEDEDHLLVTFSNYGVSSVWYTTDGGSTWIEKESNLPDMPIRWALIHPINEGQALLATETGVWWTNTLKENNTTWIPTNDNMANVRVDMIRIRESDNLVLAATHGRGLFTSTYNIDPFYVGTNELVNDESNFTIYPNPATDHITIERLSSSGNNCKISLSDINGRVIFNKKYIQDAFPLTIKLTDLHKGTYIIKLQSGEQTENKKIIIQ